MTIDKQAVQAVADLKAGYTLGHADVAVLNELARIALASLEAEAVGYMNRFTGRVFTLEEQPGADTDIQVYMPVYTAPPAPVSVPDLKPVGFLFVSDDGAVAYSPADWPMKGFNLIGQIYGDVNACRAAMLQGAEPVSNRDELPDGWVACSERMPKKNDKVLIFIDFNSENVPPSIHDAEFTGATFRRGGATVNVFPLEDGYGVTHWQPLPSPPAK
ncbi:DUF551 domain-containing protein [Enterobacter asburiae]|nr:DUF551 domain-containing protein [Enterobacter asburiae]